MDKKILFTDLDGTLLDSKKEVSRKNEITIGKALEAGHKIVISTGRPISSAKLLAKRLNLDKEGCYIIASNGAVLYDSYKEELLYETGVPLRHIRHLLDCAYEEGLHAHTYTRDHVLSERDTKELQNYTKSIRVPALIVDDIPGYLTYDPVKVLILHKESKQHLIDFEKRMAPWSAGKFDTIFSCDYMLEYCPVGITKGGAVKKLCKLLDIPVSNSIAVGDAPNDLSMIEAAGIGCVMSNGYDEVKALADYITKLDNNHDGFAEVVERFLL